MIRRWRLVCAVTAAILAGAAGCRSDGASPPTDVDTARQGAVTAALDGAALVIRNDADFAVRVAVVESEYLRTALALWCFGADECGAAIEPHGTLRVPLADVAGYAPGKEELLVHWWIAVRPGSTPGEGAEVRNFSVWL